MMDQNKFASPGYSKQNARVKNCMGVGQPKVNKVRKGTCVLTVTPWLGQGRGRGSKNPIFYASLWKVN